jgi:hypothetical protein
LFLIEMPVGDSIAELFFTHKNPTVEAFGKISKFAQVKRSPSAKSRVPHEATAGDLGGHQPNSEGLGNYFDQVWVINLKRRPERLARFWQSIEKSGWPFRTPTVFRAIDASKVGVPRFWRSGAGSYGCMRSHLVLLERAVQDDVGSLVVMEDDAAFTSTFGKDVADFLRKVPKDWQCLMLGGQHFKSKPFLVVPGVVRAGGGKGILRTHCYALRGQEIMKALYMTWADSAVHCDWVMGPCVAQFNTYAPDPFLVGQASGRSDISGGENPLNFWRLPSGKEPVIVLRAPRQAMEGLRSRGFHAGHTRDSETGEGWGSGENLVVFALSYETDCFS